MKVEYIAVAFFLIAIGFGGLYYLESQWHMQITGDQVSKDLLQSPEMKDLFEKIRLGLVVTALAGVGMAGYGVIGKDKPFYSTAIRSNDSQVTEKVFCVHYGMPSNSTGYCAICGHGRPISSGILRRCIHCGENTSNESVFCANCGSKF